MKTSIVQLRISEIEKNKWAEEAARRGMTLSEFIRFVVNAKIDESPAQALTVGRE